MLEDKGTPVKAIVARFCGTVGGLMGCLAKNGKKPLYGIKKETIQGPYEFTHPDEGRRVPGAFKSERRNQPESVLRLPIRVVQQSSPKLDDQIYIIDLYKVTVTV